MPTPNQPLPHAASLTAAASAPIDPVTLTVTPADLSCQQQIESDYLHNTLFILPDNDGEAKRAIQILTALKAPHIHVSQQKWGATLDKEWQLIDQAVLSKVKRVAIFEIPGTAAGKGEIIAAEQLICDRGLALDIIDHHYYDWVDRYRPESSLEQLCAKIGWQMSAIDIAIAINDRSYIPGLISLGLNEAQIRAYRTFDLLAQGKPLADIQKQQRKCQSLTEELKKTKRGNLWIIDQLRVDRAVLLQELALKSPDGLIQVFEMRPRKLGFSGNPEVCAHLKALDFASLGYPYEAFNYGGGDGTVSGFWGYKPKNPKYPFSSHFRRDILERTITYMTKLGIA